MSALRRRPMQPEDILDLVFAHDPQISPDGSRVAFVRTTMDSEINGYRSQVWMVPADPAAGGAPDAQAVPFTGGPGRDDTPRWSPDGRRLAFLSDRPGQLPAGEKDRKKHSGREPKRPKQLWVMDTAGGEARQLTRLRRGAGEPVWSPDGRRIAFCCRVKPEDLAPPAGGSAGDRGAADDEADRPRVIRRLSYRADGVGYFDDRNVQIFVLDLDSGAEPRQVTFGPYDHGSPAWSPDGRWLAFAANRSDDADYDWKQDLWVVDPDRPGTAGAPGCHRVLEWGGPLGGVTWTPDGDAIVFSGVPDWRTIGADPHLYRIPLEPGRTGGPPRAAGAPEDLLPGFGRPVGSVILSDSRFAAEGVPPVPTPDGGLLFLASDGPVSRVYRLPGVPAGPTFGGCPGPGGDPTPLAGGGRQVITGFSASADGRRVAFAAGDPLNPCDIFVRDPGDPPEGRRLTRVNHALLDRLDLSDPEPLEVVGEGGQRIDAWVMKPVGAEPGGRYPLVLQVHGGPHAAYGYGFFHEFQLLAAAGYGVLFSNPRGSSAYGEAFSRAVVGDWGGIDFRDVMAAVDAACRLDWVDPDRLGVAGGSYGGYMTTWIVGHTDRFKAAVAMRALTNWYSFYGTSDIGVRFTELEVPGNPWDDEERLLRHSPIRYAHRVTTPILLIHAEEDYRCPIEQAEQFYTAVKRRRVPAEFIRFPGEDHNLSRSGRPRSRLERLRHILRWFGQHLPAGVRTVGEAARRDGTEAGARW